MTPLLRIRDVSKAYPDGGGEITVFENASLEMAAGAHVGVYGKRRSGKSTLMRLAAGIDRPDVGQRAVRRRGSHPHLRRPRARLLRSRLAYIAVSDWRPNPGESDRPAPCGVARRRRSHRAPSGTSRAARAGRRGGGRRAANSPATQLSMVDRTRVMLARALCPRTGADRDRRSGAHPQRHRTRRSLPAAAHRRPRARRRAARDLRGPSRAAGLRRVHVDLRTRTVLQRATATIVPFPTPPQLGPVRDTGS